MDVQTAILLVLSALICAELGYWGMVAFRASREMREAPWLQAALRGPQPTTWPTVSVVVPAHNEERGVAACAQSILRSQYPALEVIFVLDRCTDGTLAALQPLASADPRLRIIQNQSCPPDWAGKCNAVRVGAEAATGQLLLFTDADTQFHPDLVRASVALLQQRALSMLSLLSAPRHDRWFENVVQPMASFALLKLFPIRRANAGAKRRPFANGQFMLFERSAYAQLGGHASVKDDLLEDLAFARNMKRAGMPQGVAISGGMLGVSMYDSWKSFQQGWRRIYIESCRRNPQRMFGQALQLGMVGVVLPLARDAAIVLGALALMDHAPGLAGVVAGFAVTAGAVALGTRMAVLASIYAVSRFPIWAVLLYPVSAAAVALIFVQGGLDLRARRPVRWGGRQYVLEPTSH
ncbi:MAG: glycosyltransferase family 2 protein [Phycisphaerales bacterium]